MHKRYFDTDISYLPQYFEKNERKKFKKCTDTLVDCNSNNGSDEENRFHICESFTKFGSEKHKIPTAKSSPFNKARATFNNVRRRRRNDDLFLTAENIASQYNKIDAIIEQFEDGESSKEIEQYTQNTTSAILTHNNETHDSFDNRSITLSGNINKYSRKPPQQAHGYAQQLHYILETSDADNTFLLSEHKNGQLSGQEFVVLEVHKSFGVFMAIVERSTPNAVDKLGVKWQLVIDAQLAENIFIGSKLFLSLDNNELDNYAYMMESIKLTDPTTHPILVQPNKVLLLS